MMRWLATAVANKLQRFYEDHRIAETWGSTKVSSYVFDTLRCDGFRAAAKDLIQRVRQVGQP